MVGPCGLSGKLVSTDLNGNYWGPGGFIGEVAAVADAISVWVPPIFRGDPHLADKGSVGRSDGSAKWVFPELAEAISSKKIDDLLGKEGVSRIAVGLNPF